MLERYVLHVSERGPGRRWSMTGGLGWGVVAWSVSVYIFAEQNRKVVISDRKKNTQKWVRLSRPKRDLHNTRPPTRTTLPLGSEDSETKITPEYTLGSFSVIRAVSGEASGQWLILCAKSSFFFPLFAGYRNDRHYRRNCSRASTRLRENLVCFLLSGPTFLGRTSQNDVCDVRIIIFWFHDFLYSRTETQ